MKRGKGEPPHRGWRRFAHLLLVAVLLCVLSLFLEMPKLFKSSLVPYASSTEDITKESVESVDRSNLKKGEFFVAQNSFINEDARRSSVGSSFGTSFQGVTRTHLVAEVNGGADDSRQGLFKQRFEPGLRGKRPYTVNVAQELKPYGSNTNRFRGVNDSTRELSGLQRLAEEAWILGAKVWQALKNSTVSTNDSNLYSKKVEACTKSVFKSGDKLRKARNVMVLPCGLMLGSSITVVGQPRTAHIKHTRRMSRMKKNYSTILVSQFSVELLGLKVVDGEDPPRIMHFNPRLKGDWSGYPVIEVNTNYRGQWGAAQRCIGWESTSDDEDTVDELLKCEKWIRDDENLSKESKTTWWLDRLMGHSEISKMNWQYPFVEGQTFVLTIRAGWEGYHMSIDGRHVTSFPYRTGFVMEEATGLSVKGDVDLHSVVATSLPSSHPRFSPEKLLERFDRWKAPPLPEGGIELFIGVSSASYHFAERVAVRKTWMQSNLITSSKVVARFFVALHASKEVNLQLMKEASYYNDVVILPFMDHYELLVLKTVSICEYGVHHFSAKYIMKCDDDTFIRVETVLDDVKATRYEHGLYMGNINLYHKPLRLGKWAVTYEEWPEEDYPPYANGAGYVITSDIADFIVSQHANHTLRLFKMEDVSMGMWVVQFNTSHNVYYQHNWKFCQFGCIEEYLTAHYQSPRQMLCMWEKLSQGKVQCCNFK